MGDSWIKPISFVMQWAPYLLATSEIDSNGFSQINQVAQQCQQAVQNQSWNDATNIWGDVENVVEDASANVNFYNILNRDPNAKKNEQIRYQNAKNAKNAKEQRIRYHLSRYYEPDLTTYMNTVIRKQLGIPSNVTWGSQADDVFEYLSVDFMQEVVSTVDWLLKNNGKVIVYSGNLDLICCTPATLQWMSELTWSGYNTWVSQSYNPISVNGEVAYFSKIYQNLQFYEILAAGHMVPADQGNAALDMLVSIISQ